MVYPYLQNLLMKVLRDVFGGGADINAGNPLEVHDPKVGSLISYEGTTTADGAGDGSTLIDSVLTTKPDFNGNLVIITSGAYAGQASDINGATTGGMVTAHTAFDGQILSGTDFVIVALRLTPAEVAAIEGKLDHGTHGLAALKTLIDAIESKLDDGTSGLAALKTILDNIWNVVNALFVATETGGTITTDGNEQNVYINNAPSGVYEPLKVMIDFTAQTGAETVVVREYYRIKSGGNLIKKDEVTFAGAQDPPLINVELEPNRFGIRVTMQRTAGVAKDYDWEVIYRA